MTLGTVKNNPTLRTKTNRLQVPLLPCDFPAIFNRKRCALSRGPVRSAQWSPPSALLFAPVWTDAALNRDGLLAASE